MLCSEDISLFGHGDMCVDFRDIDRTMSQYFLNIPDIDIGFQQTCGKSMAEHMWRDMQIYCRKGCVLVNHSADSLIRQFSAILICKKVPATLYFRLEIRLISL